jgi:hypothetical protein
MVIGRSEDRDNPWCLLVLRHHCHVWDPIRVPHLGQRSSDRTTKAEHMIAFDQTVALQTSLRVGGRPHMGTGLLRCDEGSESGISLERIVCESRMIARLGTGRLVVAAFACRVGGGAAAPDTTITFRFNDPEAPQMRQALDVFEQQNPGIKVDMQLVIGATHSSNICARQRPVRPPMSRSWRRSGRARSVRRARCARSTI